MKKFIAIGVTAIGGFGLLGLGSAAAFAASTTPTRDAVCSSALSQFNALASPMAASASALGADNAAVTAAVTASEAAEANYITAALKVVRDVDTSVASAQQNADVAAFKTSVNDFVHAVVAESQANAALRSAQDNAAGLNLKNEVLHSLAAGVVAPCPLP